MLTDKERAILKKIDGDPDLTAEKIHPELQSLADRGYVSILPAKSIFAGETGLSLFRLTEAGRESL